MPGQRLGRESSKRVEDNGNIVFFLFINNVDLKNNNRNYTKF